MVFSRQETQTKMASSYSRHFSKIGLSVTDLDVAGAYQNDTAGEAA